MTADVVKYNSTQALASAYTYDDKDNITNKQYTYKIDGEDETVSIDSQYDSEGRITATGYNGYDIRNTGD